MPINKPLKVVIFAFCLLSAVQMDAANTIEEANRSYKAGEIADTIAERQKNFNSALKLYSEAEENNQPIYGDGKLYFNIANSYFQLEQYPQAILYYNKALKLRPNDDKVLHNLSVALEKSGAGLMGASNETYWFSPSQLSLPERLQIFFVISLLLIAVISVFYWTSRNFWRKAIWLVGFLWFLSFSNLIYERYFAPIEAIMINPAQLRRGAGSEFAVIEDRPITSGTKVRVIQILEDGKWVKIITVDSQIGYIESNSLRII